MIKILVAIVLIIGLMLVGFRFVILPMSVKKNDDLVDFKTLVLPTTPNYYLACPASYCLKATSSAISPEFSISVTKLVERWDQIIVKQPRVYKLATKNKGLSRVYVQLSAMWHFPDFINVEFIPLSAESSTLAIYSRSQFGHSDFGVNKARVKLWLSLLNIQDERE